MLHPLRRAIALSVLALLVMSAPAAGAERDIVPEKPFKILHIMSYHSPWRWTDGQLAGFREALGDLQAEFKVFQMDTKRRSSRASIEKKAREAIQIIEGWKPDLVYTTDDDAQEYVARRYVNQHLPFVFSGVNKDPATYGFTGSRNITGVLEQEHFIESLKLLKALVPGIRKIAIVLDDAPMWDPVIRRINESAKEVPDVEIAVWDKIATWAEYKSHIARYPASVDAIGVIGIFNFKDARGQNVPYQEVLKWTAENSKLPDFGFWIDRVYFGTLAAVTVSEREQGLAAGAIARAILKDRKAPSSFPMRATTKGTPVISLARANKLGLKVKSGVLLSTEVISKFEWDSK